MLTITKYKVQEVPLGKEPRRKVLQIMVERILDIFPKEMKTQWKFLAGKLGSLRLGRKTRAIQIWKDMPLKTESIPDCSIVEAGDPRPLICRRESCDWRK